MQFSTLVALCGVLNYAAIATPLSDANGLLSAGCSSTVNKQANGTNSPVDCPPPDDDGSSGDDGGSPPPGDVSASYYMCCLYSNVSAPIPFYGPPYACIYGPSSGTCPQEANSSFTASWLCTFEPGQEAGAISCVSR